MYADGLYGSHVYYHKLEHLQTIIGSRAVASIVDCISIVNRTSNFRAGSDEAVDRTIANISSDVQMSNLQPYQMHWRRKSIASGLLTNMKLSRPL